MARSLKKGYYVAYHLLEKVKKINDTNKKKPIKTWSRRSLIIPEFIGHTFLVHNGKVFKPVHIVPDMLGLRLGAFSTTRHFQSHSSKKGKK